VKAYTAVPSGDEVVIKRGKENSRHGRLVPLLAIVVGLVTLAVLMPCDHHHHDKESSYSLEERPEGHHSMIHSMMRGFHSSSSDSSDSSDSSSDSEDRSWHHHHGEMMHMHHDGDHHHKHMGHHHMHHSGSDSKDQDLFPPPPYPDVDIQLSPKKDSSDSLDGEPFIVEDNESAISNEDDIDQLWYKVEEEESWEEDSIGESVDYDSEDDEAGGLDDDFEDDDAWVIDAENDFEQSGMDDEVFYDLSGDMVEVPPEAYDEGVQMIVEEMEDAEIPVKEERMEEPGD